LTWKPADHDVDRGGVLHGADVVKQFDVGPMRAEDLLLPRIELALPLDVETSPLESEIRTTDPGERTSNRERPHWADSSDGTKRRMQAMG
jgi:hypothetical protein